LANGFLGRFVLCDLSGEDDVVTPSAAATPLTHLSHNVRRKIIMRLAVSDDGTNSASSVKLEAEAQQKLRAAGCVHHTEAKNVKVITFPIP